MDRLPPPELHDDVRLREPVAPAVHRRRTARSAPSTTSSTATACAAPGIWALGYDGTRPELWGAIKIEVHRRHGPAGHRGRLRRRLRSVLAERRRHARHDDGADDGHRPRSSGATASRRSAGRRSADRCAAAPSPARHPPSPGTAGLDRRGRRRRRLPRHVVGRGRVGEPCPSAAFTRHGRQARRGGRRPERVASASSRPTATAQADSAAACRWSATEPSRGYVAIRDARGGDPLRLVVSAPDRAWAATWDGRDRDGAVVKDGPLHVPGRRPRPRGQPDDQSTARSSSTGRSARSAGRTARSTRRRPDAARSRIDSGARPSLTVEDLPR